MNPRTTIRTAIIIGTSVIAALAVGVWRGISLAPVEYAPTGTQKMKAHHHFASHRDPERRQRDVQAGREDPADSPMPSGPAPPEPVDGRVSFADEDELPFESVKNMLNIGLEDDFPELDLSDEDLQALTHAVVAVRDAIQARGRLERTFASAQEIVEQQGRLDAAASEFAAITGMSLTTFIRRAAAAGGIDNDRPEDEIVAFEYLDDADR